MGCDIHATLEYQTYALEPGEKPWWLSICTDLEIDHNYGLFGLLAGERLYDIHPVLSIDRGLPEDASYEFRELLEKWDGDAHNLGWVTFRELKEWQPTKETKKAYDYDLTNFRGEDWYRIMEVMANKYGDDNVRLLFFFDN